MYEHYFNGRGPTKYHVKCLLILHIILTHSVGGNTRLYGMCFQNQGLAPYFVVNFIFCPCSLRGPHSSPLVVAVFKRLFYMFDTKYLLHFYNYVLHARHLLLVVRKLYLTGKFQASIKLNEEVSLYIYSIFIYLGS